VMVLWFTSLTCRKVGILEVSRNMLSLTSHPAATKFWPANRRKTALVRTNFSIMTCNKLWSVLPIRRVCKL
jgi:hypothetical protein